MGEYGVDDNNGRLWGGKRMGEEWIEIELEKVENMGRVWREFEYGR